MKTSAERMKKWRERKAKKDSDFTKKESARVERARKKKVSAMKHKEKTRYRQAAALRKRKSRKAQKAEKNNPVENQKSKKPYKCPQSLGNGDH